MVRWLRGVWHARQRRIDLDILWPVCCELTATLDDAKTAFTVHAFHDPAWQCLSENKIYETIDKLERPK